MARYVDFHFAFDCSLTSNLDSGTLNIGMFSPSGSWPNILTLSRVNRINLGRARHAATYHHTSPMFHISVLAKEQAQVGEGGKAYTPRAQLDPGVKPLYVD